MGYRLRAGKPPQRLTEPTRPLSILPSAGREISIGHSAVMLCGWGVKADGSFLVDKCVGGCRVALCDPSLTRANLSTFEISIAHIIKRYTNVLFTSLYFMSFHLSD